MGQNKVDVFNMFLSVGRNITLCGTRADVNNKCQLMSNVFSRLGCNLWVSFSVRPCKEWQVAR
jgi:hypothetical protein